MTAMMTIDSDNTKVLRGATALRSRPPTPEESAVLASFFGPDGPSEEGQRFLAGENARNATALTQARDACITATLAEDEAYRLAQEEELLVEQAHSHARCLAPAALALACAAHLAAARVARDVAEAEAAGAPTAELSAEIARYDAERDAFLAYHWPTPLQARQFAPALEALRSDESLRREASKLAASVYGPMGVASVHAFGVGWRELGIVGLPEIES